MFQILKPPVRGNWQIPSAESVVVDTAVTVAVVRIISPRFFDELRLELQLVRALIESACAYKLTECFIHSRL